MENSLNISDEQKPFKSPPRRRRSTFFERRDSIVPQTASENVDPVIQKKESESTKYEQDMKSYYKMLVHEKDEWKKEVKERRNRYHDLKKQYQMITSAPIRSTMSYSALTDEDIEFLKGKPNLSKLVDTQQKLHKSVRETVASVRKSNELDDVILRSCESKLNKVSEYIFENSRIGPTQSTVNKVSN